MIPEAKKSIQDQEEHNLIAHKEARTVMIDRNLKAFLDPHILLYVLVVSALHAQRMLKHARKQRKFFSRK